MRQPTIFIAHGGGPCFFMDWEPKGLWDVLAAHLRGLPQTLPETPKAILVISAHWESQVARVSASPSTHLYYDYSGFPAHTYDLKWPVPGSTELAKRVQSLLHNADIPADLEWKRGLDHGVFVPLMLSFPEATLPVVQLSLLASLDEAAHVAMGKALAPLRDEGILIIGSGNSYHNGMGRAVPKLVDAFDQWLTEVSTNPNPEQRDAQLCQWAMAPGARHCHERHEHLLPLHVVAGAAGDDVGTRVYSDRLKGVAFSGYRFG